MTAKTILFVDDEPLVAKLYSRALENAGYRVLFASNGKEGVEQAKNTACDLILTDMHMPALTGAAMAGVLTGRGLKSCPIILLSATDSGEGLMEAVGDGCDDFLQKGDSFQKIMSRVGFWLDGPFDALPDDARSSFLSYAPLASAEITALRRLSSKRSLMVERAIATLQDQILSCDKAFGQTQTQKRRFLGVCAGILDTLGRSDPLSYLRRGDLIMQCVTGCLPHLVPSFRDDLADFSSWQSSATYLHAKETLILNPA